MEEFTIPNGIDVEAAAKWTREGRLLKDFLPKNLITNEELLELDVDVLVPAAIDGVITEKNAGRVKAKIIAEGANGPLTTEAVDICTANGAFIIPDILCNAGGVIVSYFEWVQGLQNFFWDLDQINSKLYSILKNAFDEVIDCHESYKVDMKRAAFIAALKRLATAMRMRGFYFLLSSFFHAHCLLKMKFKSSHSGRILKEHIPLTMYALN